jgi:hypothetical protein
LLASRWSVDECSTQCNAMHTVTGEGRNPHRGRNVRRSQSGRPPLAFHLISD